MSTQTAIESFLESSVNVASGLIGAIILWRYFIPVAWMDPADFSKSIKVTGTFTVYSLIRGFFWRRFFNAKLHKAIHRFMLRIYNGK